MTTALSQNKELLLQEYIHANLPLFQRKDIRTGSCLGKGSFSKVYKINRVPDALNTSIATRRKADSLSFLSSLLSRNDNKEKKKKYAMKVLRNSTMRQEDKYMLEAKEDMKKEIQALSLFQHENIINVYGYGFCSPKPSSSNQAVNAFLIIDRIESTLHDRLVDWQYFNESHIRYQFYHNHIDGTEYFDYAIEDDREEKHNSWLILKEKLNIAMQIVDALRYMHDCGYLYRDLKPQNTGLVNATDSTLTTKVKLFDFGTCRELPQNDNKNDDYKMSFVGSHRYMAPEVHGWKRYNQKADVYSWSILFYEMLTLENAYPLYSAQEYKKNIFENHERPQFLNQNSYYDLSVPEEIKNILQCSWDGDLSKRYSSEEAQEKLLSFCSKHSFFSITKKENEERMENTVNMTESSY